VRIISTRRVLCLFVVVAALLAAVATKDANPWERAATLTAFILGGSMGILVSRRRWWLGLSPLLLGVTLGILSSHLFGSDTGYNGGDWSVSAVILFAGLWCGVLGTIVELIVVAVRAAVAPSQRAAH
jgi:disulfide bond formation protein DsbB